MRAALFIGIAICAGCSEGSPGGGRGSTRADGVIIWSPSDGGPGPEVDLGVAPDGGDSSTDLGAAPDSGLDAGALDVGPADAGPPDPCLAPSELTLTATAARARPDLAGTVVRVEGVLSAGEPTCTPRTCSDAPCCDACTAEVLLDDALPIDAEDCFAFNPSCLGSPCGLVCSPPLFGTRDVITGRLELSEDEVRLQVLRFGP